MIGSSLAAWLATPVLAGQLILQAAGSSPALDEPATESVAPAVAPANVATLTGRTATPGSAPVGAATLPPSLAPAPAIVTGWSTAESRPPSVQRAIALANAGWLDSAAIALRRAMTGLSGRDRALALFDLGLVETTTAASVARLGASADSVSDLRASAWTAAGEALLVAGYPEAARGWFLASRGLKQGVASERASFLAGVSWLQAARWAEARVAFSDYLVEYLSGRWQTGARLGIALANEQVGRRREAVEIYRAVLAQHRGFDDEPWLLAHLADLVDTEAPEEATRLRQRLRDEYRDWRRDGEPVATAQAAPSRVPAVGPARSDSPAGTTAPPRSVPSAPASRSAPPVRAPATTATPPAPPRPPATTPTSQAEAWSIQVGAFREQARAEQQSRRFTARGWRTEVVRRAPWFTVYAGRYNSRAAAEAARADAARIAGQDVHLVRR